MAPDNPQSVGIAVKEPSKMHTCQPHVPRWLHALVHTRWHMDRLLGAEAGLGGAFVGESEARSASMALGSAEQCGTCTVA